MNMNTLKGYWIHAAAIVAFFLSTCIFFYPQFQGQTLRKGDIMQWEGMRKEVKDFKDATGETSLWTGSMFSGMPTYYIQTSDSSNLIIPVIKAMKLGMKGEVGRFLLGMICFYILMLVLRIDPVIGIFGSILFAYTTNNMVLLGAGHYTKISTILTAPLIIAGVIAAYRNKNLLGLVLFGLGMAINLKSDHPQMTYYLGLVMMIYVVAVFVNAIKTNTIGSFVKSSMYLLVGLLLAFGSFSSKLLPTLEYSADTMRGKPILTATDDPNSSSQVDGLAWSYAMRWSNGWIDLLSSFIPQVVGGSSGEKVSSNSGFAKLLRKAGQNTRGGVAAPTYWGGLPSTSGPVYFGAVVFLLFFIGAVVIKGSLKWWIVAATLFTFLVSLGQNLEWFNRLLFDYFPAFNKFRTPNSVLSVTAIIIPILAMVTLNKILTDSNINFKKVLYAGLGFAGFCIILGLVGPMIFDFVGSSDSYYAQQFDTSILEKDRADMMRSSSLKSGFLMLLTCGVLFLFSKSKVSKIIAVIIIGLLGMADQFMVNSNYISPDDYMSKRNFEASYAPRAVDTKILQDTDPHYRVLDRSVDTWNSTFASYFHKSIGGYHAAKLQRYNDIIEKHIAPMNQNVLNMLNTKYIIFSPSQGAPAQAQRNTAALGNAWYVNDVKIVNSSDQEIDALTSIDPLGTAVVHKEFEAYVSGLSSGQKNGSIKLTSYKPNELVYQSSGTIEQLAVFSEVWYGPDKGWNAYIDGNKVDHIRANYVLRAMKIPAGNHEIKFVFEPASYKTGSLISLISSALLLLLIGFFFWRVYSKGWDNVDIL